MMDQKTRDLREQLEYWKERALTDALTGLRNREALEEDLSEHNGLEFVFIDVDDFKTVNDTQGHDAGDRILQEVARVLDTEGSGTAYRLGGEEFVIATAAGTSAGGRMVRAVREQTEVTISAGTGRSISEADMMMYKSKLNGKDQHTHYKAAIEQ